MSSIVLADAMHVPMYANELIGSKAQPNFDMYRVSIGKLLLESSMVGKVEKNCCQTLMLAVE